MYESLAARRAQRGHARVEQRGGAGHGASHGATAVANIPTVQINDVVIVTRVIAVVRDNALGSNIRIVAVGVVVCARLRNVLLVVSREVRTVHRGKAGRIAVHCERRMLDNPTLPSALNFGRQPGILCWICIDRRRILLRLCQSAFYVGTEACRPVTNHYFFWFGFDRLGQYSRRA